MHFIWLNLAYRKVCQGSKSRTLYSISIRSTCLWTWSMHRSQSWMSFWPSCVWTRFGWRYRDWWRNGWRWKLSCQTSSRQWWWWRSYPRGTRLYSVYVGRSKSQRSGDGFSRSSSSSVSKVWAFIILSFGRKIRKQRNCIGSLETQRSSIWTKNIQNWAKDSYLILRLFVVFSQHLALKTQYKRAPEKKSLRDLFHSLGRNVQKLKRKYVWQLKKNVHLKRSKAILKARGQ